MPTCPNCNFELSDRDLQAGVCPDCGRSVDPPETENDKTIVLGEDGVPNPLEADEASSDEFRTVPEIPENQISTLAEIPPDSFQTADEHPSAFDADQTLPEIPPQSTENLSTVPSEPGEASEELATVADISQMAAGEVSESGADEDKTVQIGSEQLDELSEALAQDSDSGADSQAQTNDTIDEADMPPSDEGGESSHQTMDETPSSESSNDDDIGQTVVGETWADDSLGKTIDSDTWDEDELGKTVQSEEFDDSLSKTIDSDGVPDGIVQTVQDAWSDGDGDDQTNPGMTIKGKGVKVAPARATLVIKPRSLGSRDAETRLELSQDELEYELLKVLGEGGMGVVWDARQTSIDRSVAVKMIKDDRVDDQDQRQKFLAEAVVTGDLDHPNIVPIYDVGSNRRGALFYAMKKVQGIPWQDVIAEKSLPENLETLMKVADAIAFAHSRGIIHRDLKPENIMLGDYGEVLVMDWGLAQSTGQFKKSSSISQTCTMGGTPAYMAPEMATGPVTNIGPHSDVYLLGAILYQVVTGKPPHTGKNAMKCLMSAAKNVIRPTDKTGELVDIAMKAMATNPKERHADVPAFQTAIREYQAHSESVALTSRAEGDLERARTTNDYQDFSRSLFAFEEALAMWTKNRRARRGISKARLAYAQNALVKGDFDLGISLLDPSNPEHQELLSQLKAAQQEREARVHRIRAMKRIGVMMAVLFIVVVSGFSYWVNLEREEAVRQKTIAEENEAEAKRQEIEAIAQRQEADRQRDIATENEEEAKRQEKIARENEAKALAAKKAEEEQKKVAQANEAEAKRQERIAKESEAKALAAKKAEEEQRKIAQANERKAIEAKEAEEYEAYVARIGLAAAKIRENSFDEASRLLEQCRPSQPGERDLRNWEWGRLMHLCGQSDRTFDAGVPLDAIALSPDGASFAVGGWNGTAQVWEIASGKLLHVLPHGGSGIAVSAIAFSPDGKYIATGSNKQDDYIQLWDAQTGKRIPRTFGVDGKTDSAVEHTGDVLSVAFSRDGSRLLTGSRDRTARLWDVQTGKQLQRFLGHNWWVWSAAFSPDEKQIVTASQDGTAIVWDITTTDSGKITSEPGNPFTGHDGPIYSASFSPDGRYVVTGGYDKRVLLWRPEDIKPYAYGNVNTEQPIAPPAKYQALEGHTAPVRCVAFSRDGDLILSAGHDNTIKVWDFETGRALKTFRGHASWVSAACFSQDGSSVLSCSHDNRAKKWTIDKYEENRELRIGVLRGRMLEGHHDAVMDVAFSSDGTRIVTASRDRTAKMWDVRTGDETREFSEGHAFLASSGVFLPDGRMLVTAAVDNTARLWDVGSGTELQQMKHTGRAAALAVSRDGKWIATGSDDHTAKLWNVSRLLDPKAAPEEKKPRVLTGHHSEVTAVAFSPDDRFLLTGDARGRAILWDLATGESRHVMRSHTRKIVSAAFLPNGRRVLTASGDNTVAQWDVQTGKEQLQQILKHPDAVVAMALTPDGQHALTSCADGQVRLWNVETAQVMSALPTDGQMVNSLGISTDGHRALGVAAEDRIVHFWDLNDPAEQTRAPRKSVLDLNRRGGLVWSATFAPWGSGQSVVTIGGFGARLWDLRNSSETMTFTPHGAVASARFSPDGKRLVTGSWDNSAKIWNVTTGHAELKLQGAHTSYVNSVVFSPDGASVITASNDNTAVLWDAKTGKVLRTLTGHTDAVMSAVFSPDGGRVLTASSDRTARIWDAATGKELVVFPDHDLGVLCAEFSADGKKIVTGGEDNVARVWDAKTATLLHKLSGHTAPVAAVAFSPDGRRVVTGSKDDKVKLWDVSDQIPGSAKEILTLDGHSREVTSVAFSRDGKYIVSGGQDDRAILWLTDNWGEDSSKSVARSE